MTEEILIHGSREEAEVVGEEIKTYKCGCGFKLQLSGGIAINDGMKVIVEGSAIHKCPICGGDIELKNG